MERKQKKRLVKAMVEAGATNRQIASAIGIRDASGVSHYIRKNLPGIRRKRVNGWTVEERQRLMKMWASDMKMEEIAMAFAYKHAKNIRQAMSMQMYRLRKEGKAKSRRTVNGVRKEEE